MVGEKPLPTIVALLVIASAVAPGLAAGAIAPSVEVSQESVSGTVTVTVTDNGTAVDNATVNVTSPNGSYAGTGTHLTGPNGTVDLPAPNQTVDVLITAEAGNVTDSVEVTLLSLNDSLAVSVSQAADGNATVTVEQFGSAVANASVTVTSANDTYAGDGDYSTDENGTVALQAPNETVTVTILAEHDGVSAETTVELAAEDELDDNESDPFGQLVAAFIQMLNEDYDLEGLPRGHHVADFVLANNPGSPPDHAGPPNGTDGGPSDGNSTDADSTDVDDDDRSGGPPEHANDDRRDKGDSADGSDEKERGPPAHANNDKQDNSDENGDEATETEDA